MAKKNLISGLNGLEMRSFLNHCLDGIGLFLALLIQLFNFLAEILEDFLSGSNSYKTVVIVTDRNEILPEVQFDQ